MILVENEGINNPHLNLALEEYIVRNFGTETDYLLFYVNSPSIIIGKNQNTLEEINHEYVKEKELYVVRRVSGGGAVYHDFGNLNFSFITNHDITSLNNFKKVTAPIVNALEKLGVHAEMKGRNDVVVNDKKISGNAQFSTGKRMISHGTLMLDSDLNEVSKALTVKMSKIKSKGHKSARSRVANISEFMDHKISVEEFRKAIIEHLFEGDTDFKTYRLSEEEWEAVHQLKKEKYDTWDWNFGRSPKFNIRRENRFSSGTFDIRIFVEKGHIQALTIFGDFFGFQPIEGLEEALTGIRYEEEELEKVISEVELNQFIGGIEEKEFLSLLYGSDEVV